MAKTVKKVVKKKRTPKRMIIRLFSLVAFVISGYLLYGVAKEVMTTVELKNQLEVVENELAVIKEENAQLTSQRDKLENPDYVQSYARGNYMLSKEGEQIFYLPGAEEEEGE